MKPRRGLQALPEYAGFEQVSGIPSPVAYYGIVGVAGVVTAVGSGAARRHPGYWTVIAARALAVVLVAKGGVWVFTTLDPGPWTVQRGLPLYLCDFAVFVAAWACWTRKPLLVEITWFWGMAGTLEAVVTPELPDAFPHLRFFRYTVGHLTVVMAAIYLVVGMRLAPRAGALRRVVPLTAAYIAVAGLTDVATGANYMFLRRQPVTPSALDAFGPWPWYLLGAAAIAAVSLTVLDAPWWRARRRLARNATVDRGDGSGPGAPGC